MSWRQEEHTLRVEFFRRHIRLPCNREHEIERIVLVTAHALADDRLEHGYELAHCGLRRSPLRDTGLIFVKTDPLTAPLRKEPRFQAIERALKFPVLPEQARS